MAGTADRRLVKLGPWPRGVNNLAAEDALPRDDLGTRPIALREADNVDLDRTGWPRRRRGSTRLHPLRLAHSLWSAPSLSFGLLVDDGELCALHPDETIERLAVEVGPLPVSYALVNDRICWTTSTRCGLLTLDRVAWSWAPESPAGLPRLSAVTGFGLDAGRYQVAVTFVDGLGRESGAPLAATIEVAVNGGIQVSALPQPLDTARHPFVNVYLSAANDAVLRLHTQRPVGATTLLLGAPAAGRLLATQFLEPLPPGQIVRYYNGRQYVAQGRDLLWSEPLRYGLYQRARNRVRFPDTIDLVEPVVNGLFVASGPITYWLTGADPKDFTLRPVYRHGALPGSSVIVSAAVFGADSGEDVVAWVSRNGYFCLGAPGGSVTPLKQGEAAIDDADRGAALFRAADGLQQLLVALRAPQPQRLAVTDRAVAHVIHRDA